MSGRQAANTVEALRLVADGFSVPEAATLSGADRSTIYKAIKRKAKKLAAARRRNGK